MTNDKGTNQENKSKPSGQVAELLWAMIWLATGIAMVIWPDVLAASAGPCDDPTEMIGCFISNSWGTPGGIAISFILAFFTGVSAIWKRRNRDDR